MRKGHIYHKRPKPKSVQQQLLARAQAKIREKEKHRLKGNGVRRKKRESPAEVVGEVHMDVDMKPQQLSQMKTIRDQLKNQAIRSQLRR